MTLQEIAEQVFSEEELSGKGDVVYIGFYTEDENGNPNRVIPDYADEILETHGQCEVEDYFYAKKDKVLVVELKEDN